MSDDVARKEAELEQAKLSRDYDAAVEAYRGDPSDENKATKDGLAEQLVAARQSVRLQREAEDAALTDGVARPEAVSGTSEVNG